MGAIGGSGGSRTARTETVTVLFTDIVGSTELASQLGHDQYEALRRDHFAALRAAVSAHAGVEVKTTGDGLMVCFASAVDALGGAVAMQQAVDRHARARGMRAHIRIGVASGEATREGDDVYGTPVVEAARLCAAAGVGQILVSDVVRALARSRGGHTFTPVGELALKGFPEPLPACAVAWAPLPADAGVLPLPGPLAGGGQFAFAGRNMELESLLAAWKEVERGAQRVTLIAGESGIGKTRLAAETARAARAAGGSVLYGRCDEDLGVPFQPFVEALEHFIVHSGAGGLREQLGRHAGELVRLIPDLAARARDLRPPLRADAETERYRMFEAVASWLVAASAERPVLLVLDDLHWAAKPTLLLLRHVVRAAHSARLLIIATYRDTDLDRRHPLTETLADLRRDAAVERLALRGLDLAGVEALLVGAAGADLDAAGRALARTLHAETEGNPFFIGEIVRHLVESEALHQREGRWVSDLTVSRLGIPAGIKEVIHRRLNRLSQAANQALSTAAVIGRDFDLTVLGAVSELDEGSLVSALEEAIAACLVEETDVVDSYRFAHALVHETLYHAAGASRRVRLHGRIGDAIAARRPDDVMALAYHYHQAAAGGDVDEAVDYSTRAGDQARMRLAHHQAVVLYGQALGLLEGRAPRDTAERCELLLRLGEAQRDAGDAAYRPTLLDAGRLAQRLGDVERLARAALANSRGFASAAGVVDAERVAVLEAALAAFDPGDGAVRARLLASLAGELMYSVERERVQGLAHEALAMARRVGDAATLAHVLHACHDATWTPDRLAERLGTGQEYFALAGRLGDPLERWWAAELAAWNALAAGDLAGFDRFLAVVAQLTDELGRPTLRWTLSVDKSMRALLAGQTDEAERLATEAREVGESTGQPDALTFYGGQLWEIRRVQGRVGEIEALVTQLLADNPGLPALRAAVAMTYCELERGEDARALLERDATNRFADFPYDLTWLTAMTCYARVSAQLGATEPAAFLYERLAPFHGQIGCNGLTCNGSVALYLGLLATALGQHGAADAHFAEAHAMHERIDAPYWLARTRIDWAGPRLARDDRDGARELLADARAAARQYGFAGVEREAMRLLEQARG